MRDVPPVRAVLALMVVVGALLPLRVWAGGYAGLGYSRHEGRALPLEARFADETGRTQTLGQALAGDVPTLLVPGYLHCPALCGVTRDDLMRALADAGLHAPASYRLLAVSVDPAERPAAAAAARAADIARHRAGADQAGWHYLTGDAAAIAALLQAIGLRGMWIAQVHQFVHPAGLVVVRPDGRIGEYLLGVGYTGAALRAALARAAAKQSDVTSAGSSILLLCLHFDPANGRWSAAAIAAMRMAAAAFLAGCALVALRMRRRVS